MARVKAVHKMHPDRTDEIEVVFRRALGVIHYALATYYRMTEEESGNAERDLYIWFHRLARRGGTRVMPVRALRVALLSAACQYGRSFRIWKLGGTFSADDQLNTLLQREPAEVAGDLEQQFRGDA